MQPSRELEKQGQDLWSLTSRVALLSALVAALVSIALISTMSFYLDSAVRENVLAHGREEIAEMQAYFALKPQTPDAFDQLATALQTNHPDTRFAWRIWTKNGDHWGDFGDVHLIDSAGPLALKQGLEDDLGGGYSWFTERLNDELVMGLVFSDAEQAQLVSGFLLTATSFGVLALALSALGGILVGRQTGTALAKVAASVRSIDALDSSQMVTVPNLPTEIRNVVNALGDMLQNIRNERDRVMVMTAGLAHELRSPIQNMLGSTEVALLRDRDVERYREVLGEQIDELRSLARVVDNLVILCTRKGSAESLERFNMGKEAEIRLERERRRAERDAIEVELTLSGSLEISGDREAVMLALGNLVENAVYWSSAGSRVAVDLKGESDTVEITVDDSGPGVPEAERDEIFEAFFQGATKSRGDRIGYGLGLALTRDAVSAHGGKVWVGESPQGGARFRVSLPRTPVFDAA